MNERTTVTGRLGQEPIRRTTSKGDVTEFSLASTPRLLGPDGRWTDGVTTWYVVSAWDRLGANAADSLRKGQPVIVHGTVKNEVWEGRDGETRSTLKMRASAIGHDLNLGTAAFAKPAPAAAPPAAAPAPGAPNEPAAEAIGHWGPMAEEPREPAPAGGGWTTVAAAEDDPPF